MNIDHNNDQQGNGIVADEVALVTPTNQAIYEAGKEMLVESVNIGREFCKFMIGTSMSAIPIYLALVRFVLPEKYAMTLGLGLIGMIPAFMFLGAGIVFLVGYLPQTGVASLDIPEEIERERQRTAKRRYRLGLSGFVVFCIAVLSGLLVNMYMLSMPIKSIIAVDAISIAEKQLEALSGNKDQNIFQSLTYDDTQKTYEIKIDQTGKKQWTVNIDANTGNISSIR